VSKHTPGPWNVHPMASCGVWAANGIHVAATGGDMADDADPDEQEANAKLIATAPALLAALQEIVAIWDDHATNPESPLGKARAAVKKATE